MTLRIFVLRTQLDIIDFRLGHRPATILVRDFETEAEIRAYWGGVDAVRDEFDRILSLKVIGSKVRYARRSDDLEADRAVHNVEVEFATHAEVRAHCKGIVTIEISRTVTVAFSYRSGRPARMRL